MKAPEPPPLAEWLVRALVAHTPYGDALLGDLREGFVRRSERSPRAGRRWYWRRAGSVTMKFLPSFGRVVWRRRSSPGGDSWPTVLASEIRHALRVLARKPATTAIIGVTLAVGIGANAAIFGVVRGVLLKPLLYPEPDRVVMLWSTSRQEGGALGGVSRQDADDWAARNHAFEAIGTYTSMEGNVAIGAEPQRVKVALASADVFRALGVSTALGRPLIPADDRSAPATVVVLSHGFWERVLGSDRSIVGRSLTLDGRPLTIVGVMPASFEFPDPATALWIPFGAPPDATGPRMARWVAAVARLRPGVSLATAQSEMSTIASQLAAAYPASNREIGALVQPLLRAQTGDVRQLLFVAWGVVGLVLLVVVTNTANLFLARAAANEGEVAVRSALGASRSALARRFLVESVLLALIGGGLGVALAVVGLPVLRQLGGIGIPRAGSLTLDPVVLAYSLAASIVVGIALGLVPAFGAAHTAPAAALRRSTRSLTPAHERVRRALIVAQVAFAAVVLVGSGLLFRSFGRLSRVEPGFTLANGVAFRVAPDWKTYPNRTQGRALYDGFFARLRALPGVVEVAAVNRLPLTGSWWTTEYEPEGNKAEPGKEPLASYRVVTPGYFRAIGIPLLRGRTIEPSDAADARGVVVVSRALADRAWPGQDPIGRRITFDTENRDAAWYSVVGIVADVHTTSLADAPQPLAYVPFPQARFGHFGDWGMDVVVRTSGSGMSVIDAARRELHAIAPTLPLFAPMPLDALVAKDLARQHFLVLLVGAFALTAVFLAGLGLYGVIAYDVTQRRAELGLRMALGAAAGVVWRSVVVRALTLAAVGAATGLAGAAAMSRVLSGLLYGVQPLDPMTFAAVPAVLLVVAAVAAWVPAARAARVDVMEALRSD